jgi:DNA repair exonuclease SbcCD ATPase subunit
MARTAYHGAADRMQILPPHFQREPLAAAGLFAICGPTGFGKSALLDALCLALYDNTPRLKRATGRGMNLPDVGDETVSPQDPRTLLRRGAGEGYAEVDFVGNDNAEYRARWSVRRARGRADGRLQASDRSLTGLAAGHPAAGSLKGEVLSQIEMRQQTFPRSTLGPMPNGSASPATPSGSGPATGSTAMPTGRPSPRTGNAGTRCWMKARRRTQSR